MITARPSEAEFDEFYTKELALILTSHAGLRKKQQKKARAIAGCILISGLILTGWLVSLVTESWIPMAVIGFIGGVASLIFATLVIRKSDEPFDRAIATDVGALLARRALNADHILSPSKDFVSLEQLSSLRLIRNGGGQWQVTNGVSGTYMDIGFKICKAAKTERKDDGYRTIFEGLVMEIDVPQQMPTIIMRRKRNTIDRFSGNAKVPESLKPVALGDSDFQEMFEAWTDDSALTHTLLGPQFTDRFRGLSEELTHRPLEFALGFRGSKCYLCWPHPGKFLALSSRGKSQDEYAATCRAALEGFYLPQEILQALTETR